MIMMTVLTYRHELFFFYPVILLGEDILKAKMEQDV